MSSSTALKRAVTNTFRYPQANHRQEIFLHKSSSSSLTDDDRDVKMLDETNGDNGLTESDKRKRVTTNPRHSSMNNYNGKGELGGPMIQELLQSNLDLKYVLEKKERMCCVVLQTHFISLFSSCFELEKKSGIFVDKSNPTMAQTNIARIVQLLQHVVQIKPKQVNF